MSDSSEAAKYAKAYFAPMMKHGTAHYIQNVDAEISLLQMGEKYIPFVIPKFGSQCYVCSPYDHYIRYATYELRHLKPFWIRWIFHVVVAALGQLLKRCHFNDVVYVNNWLLSTNLYPKLSKEEILHANRILKQRYPRRMIVYRSLNEATNQQLLNDLLGCGGKKMAGRQVYMTDPKDGSYQKKKAYKIDQTFLKKSNLSIRGATPADAPAIKKCYDDLYLSRYSPLNPQFSEDFFRNAIENQLFQFQLFSEQNQIVAALGYFCREQVMTTPIFGYDTLRPQELGLYRLLSSLLMGISEKNGHVLHQSSGAAHFKSQRGASPYIEYNVYFDDGVLWRQRVSWWGLSWILNSVGVFLLRRLKL